MKDETKIEIHSGQIQLIEFDPIKDPLNYSVVSALQTEFYQIDIKNFYQIVREQALTNFKKTLCPLQNDGLYR